VTKLYAVLVLTLILIQSLLLPAAVKAAVPECQYVTVTTLPATNVTSTTATFKGERCYIPIIDSPQQGPLGGVNVNQYAFQYGTTPGSYTHSVDAVMESEPSEACVIVRADVTDLAPCTTYYVRLKVLLAVASAGPYLDGAQGAGIGIDCGKYLQGALAVPIGFYNNCISYGNEVSFQTTGCPTYIGTGPTSHQSGGFNGTTTTTPTNLSNIVVQSATITSTKVSPGEKVDITASVTNKGNSNGTSKVTLYINGQEAESKGISLTSGESTQVYFSVSRNDPGTYSVYVNGVPAGNLTVDLFTNNDALIYGVIALFTIGIVGVLYLVFKRRTA